jgi:hypothetical protein
MFYALETCIGGVIQWKTEYTTVRTFPQSNNKIVEKSKIDTPNIQIHESSLS